VLIVSRDSQVEILENAFRGNGDISGCILIKAPPFSGKTSILQAVVRKVQDSFTVIFVDGKIHKDDSSFLANLHTALEAARASAQLKKQKVLLVIDEGHYLYKFIDTLVKSYRDLRMLVAASYYVLPDSDSASPTQIDEKSKLGIEFVGISKEVCATMLEKTVTLLRCSFVEDAQLKVLEQLLLQCQFEGCPSSANCYHIGLFKHFIFELENKWRNINKPLSLQDCMNIIWDINLPSKNFVTRACYYLREDAGVLRNNPKMVEFLKSYIMPFNNIDTDTYAVQIKSLEKSTIMYRNEGKLNFSLALARRAITKVLYPGCIGAGNYVVSTIDDFVLDMVSCITPDEIATSSTARNSTKHNSPNEYQWQQMCYIRVYELLGPLYPILVESSKDTVGNSRMDMYIPSLGWVLEYVQNASPGNANEHHARFERGGKYCVPNAAYRVIDFRDADSTEARVLTEHQPRHITVWVPRSESDPLKCKVGNGAASEITFGTLNSSIVVSQTRKRQKT